MQVEDIQEKLATAPDKSYEIGVVIGTFIPFVLLVALAYMMFNYMKNRKNE